MNSAADDAEQRDASHTAELQQIILQKPQMSESTDE